MSKWFVGSSNKSTWGFTKEIKSMTTRVRMPSDMVFILRVWKSPVIPKDPSLPRHWGFPDTQDEDHV